MPDEITKSELQLMIEVQTKSAQQMERVANQLTTIVDEQKTISSALNNGMSKKIVDEISKTCEARNKTIDSMAKDILWTKIIVGSVSLVVTIVWVILKLTGH